MKELNKIFLKSTNNTKILASRIAEHAEKKLFIGLYGDLGSGKTTFARFFINAFSKGNHNVKSPTFSMVNTYELQDFTIWHFDLYRLKVAEEIFYLDYDMALNDIVIVEWPEIIKRYLPKNRIEVIFSEDANLRRFANLRFLGNYKSTMGCLLE